MPVVEDVLRACQRAVAGAPDRYNAGSTQGRVSMHGGQRESCVGALATLELACGRGRVEGER